MSKEQDNTQQNQAEMSRIKENDRKSKDKEKIKISIPSYQMTKNEYYLLLTQAMKRAQTIRINGVDRDFLNQETYHDAKKMVKDLKKRNLVTIQGDDMYVHGGLNKALDIVVSSPSALSFQNAALRSKGQFLVFYYAKGEFVGVLIDKGKTIVTRTSDVEALYRCFQGVMEARGLDAAFSTEKFYQLWGKNDDSSDSYHIGSPVSQASMVLSYNQRDRKNRFSMLLSDRQMLQIITGDEDAHYEELSRETTVVTNWYGAVVRMLEELRNDGNDSPDRDGSEKPSDETGQTPEKAQSVTEYDRIVEIPGFPKTGIGFFGWVLKQFILGIPHMLKAMVKKKVWKLILPIAAALLFFLYNMFMTIYKNDTFFFERRALWGNLTPYLLGGVVNRPSRIPGFSEGKGMISTAWMAGPFYGMALVLLRSMLGGFRKRKTKAVKDLFGIGGKIKLCNGYGYWDKRVFWALCGCTFLGLFFIKNPLTMVVIALYALLAFAFGMNSQAVQMLFFWNCAKDRKKVERGEKKKPESLKAGFVFLQIAIAASVYFVLSVLVWNFADYKDIPRIVVTVLVILFCAVQIFLPDKKKPGEQTAAAKVLLFVLFLGGMLAIHLAASKYGVVLADDGGWTESGGWKGLFDNAGFSIILGVSIMTLLAAAGVAMVPALIATGVVIGTQFAIGLTDTEAGEYVRKSQRQFLYGVDDGDTPTLMCGVSNLISDAATVVSLFVAPEALVTQFGSKAGKVISFADNAANLLVDGKGAVGDIGKFMAGDNTVSFGDIALDGLGLAGDLIGLKNDWGDLNKIKQGAVGEAMGEGTKLLDDIAENNVVKDYHNIVDAYNTQDTDKIKDIVKDGAERLVDRGNTAHDIWDMGKHTGEDIKGIAQAVKGEGGNAAEVGETGAIGTGYGGRRRDGGVLGGGGVSAGSNEGNAGSRGMSAGIDAGNADRGQDINVTGSTQQNYAATNPDTYAGHTLNKQETDASGLTGENLSEMPQGNSGTTAHEPETPQEPEWEVDAETETEAPQEP